MDLGINESTLDGNLDFLGNLDTNTNVTLSITNGDNSLESSSLTSLGLLLDREDAHDLIGELGLGVGEESIDDWGFLDWDGVSVNFFKRDDMSVLDKSSELGKWSPLFFGTSSSTWATSAASSTSTTSITTSSSVTKSSAASAASSSFTAFGWGWSAFGCWSNSSWSFIRG
jgi:hypothetical protein